MHANPSAAEGGQSWSSRFGFIMASVGFAVGLGNIWKFPYITGENGGGAFVLVYLLCAFGIGVPILMAEVLIGRRGQASASTSMQRVAQESGSSSRWSNVGGMTIWTALLINVVYAVVAGWVLRYLYLAASGHFEVLDSGERSAAYFSNLLADPKGMFFWTGLVLALCGFIIAAGVQKGIERAVTVLMPTLFVLLLIMVGYSAVTGAFAEGLRFLFAPDFSKIDANVVLVAIGQAFFSVSVAMAGMISYGSYLPKNVSIGRSAMLIVSADTLVALLAGLAIFPLVFQHGLDPSGGPGLIFETLPVAFSQMPGGRLFSAMFFLLLSVAAITSMVGLLEPVLHWAEERWQVKRRLASVILCGGLFCCSLISIYSYSELQGLHPLSWLPSFETRNINDILSFLTDQLMLPLGGLLIAIFTGWFVSRSVSQDELALPDGAYGLWRFLIRFPVPVAIALVLVLGIGG